MADEFQSGICTGNWWNPSPRNGLSAGGSVPCSASINDIGKFSGWSTEMVDMKVRSYEESVSVSDSSMVYQDGQKPQGSDSVSGGGVGGAGSAILMDSTLQTMGFGLSAPTMDWNQPIINRNSGRAENNFNSMLQDDLTSRPNYLQENIMESSHVQKNWSPNSFPGTSEDSLIAYKQTNQGLYLDQNRLNSGNSSEACTVTCQGMPTSFSMDSVPYGYQMTFLQGLFELDLQPQASTYDNRTITHPYQPNYTTATNELPHSLQKFPQYQKASPPKQQTNTNQLHFANNTHFWNPSAASMSSTRPSFLPLGQNQYFTQTSEEKPSYSNCTAKPKPNEVRDSGSTATKAVSEPVLKRPRVETPSPLPTFKVRKEKLGDRVTALQQLVSPFGKTDTASVLFEAIDYIKFLHEQVSVLSAPYMKNGAPIQRQQSTDQKSKDAEGPEQDLRSRGLCLVPMSSIFPVTNETTADFWTPTFRGTYR